MSNRGSVSAAERGKCPVCGFRWRLRKDGTLQAHMLWSSPVFGDYCIGAGMKPEVK